MALESELRLFGPNHPTVATRIFETKLPAGHPHTRTAHAWRETILRSL